MSLCPDCGCDLPDSQTLCTGCYDARYAEVGLPIRSKSFRESLTRLNVLLVLGTFAFGFLEFRFNTYDYFPFNLLLGYRYHLMPTKTADFVRARIICLLRGEWQAKMTCRKVKDCCQAVQGLNSPCQETAGLQRVNSRPRTGLLHAVATKTADPRARGSVRRASGFVYISITPDGPAVGA